MTESLAVRYGIAVFMAIAAFITTGLLFHAVGSAVYAPLVGAVALTAFFFGLGPTFACAGVAWALAYWGLAEPSRSYEGLGRWGINLVVALGIGLLAHLIHTRRTRAEVAVRKAEAAVRDLVELQELATSLSAAITAVDVAHALISMAPPIVGARGGSVGIIDGDELLIVDSQSGNRQTHRPGSRIPLDARAPIARACAGESIVIRGRAEFEQTYPDGAAWTPGARGAIAAPLRVAGDVVGSLSLLFEDPAAVDGNAEAVVLVAAGLGGQALERAGLYDREVETREALNRILLMAPRFHADTEDEVTAAICREARATFGADMGMIWRRRGDRLVLVRTDPDHEDARAGVEVPLQDFPGLLDAIGNPRISFVTDVQSEVRGPSVVRARRLGVRSSLRMPVATGEEMQLVVIAAWQTVITEPDASTMLIARRLADQAALALEQMERRAAQEEAARSADETRVLQEITAALSLAATSSDVSSICLTRALEAVGADVGFVVIRGRHGNPLVFGASSGLSDDELETWLNAAAETGHPLARVLEGGEPIWLESPRELTDPGQVADTDGRWITIPLTTDTPGLSIRGALHLVLDGSTTVDDKTRRWLETVVSQCSQALERSRLLDEEQHQRERSERLQSMSERLSNALRRADVADVLLDETRHAVNADGAALATVAGGGEELDLVAWTGFDKEAVERWFAMTMDGRAPGLRSVRGRSLVFYEDHGTLAAAYPNAADALAGTGHESIALVPLIAGQAANGLVLLSWQEQHALTAEQRGLLMALSSQAAQAMDRAAHFEWERTVAETLQRSVLPASLPRMDGVELASRYVPGTAELEVGGDWYDAVALPDGKLGVAVGDVVGKGVAAAANMAQLRNALRAFALDRSKPSSVLAGLNRLANESIEAPFATAVYAVLDPSVGVCRFSSAGHPPPLIAHADGRVAFLEGARSLPLGAAPDTSYRHEAVELPAGTVLLLYTDGLVEKRDRPIDVGLELLRTAVMEAPSSEPEALVDHVYERLIGDEGPSDDIAVLAIRLLPVAPQPLHLQLPIETGSLRLVRESLRRWLTGAPLDEGVREDVVLAAWEAAANAFEHGRIGAATCVDVDGRMTDDVVRIRIQDDGAWREPDGRPERGFGLKLIRSLVPSVDVATSGAGTRVLLEVPLRSFARRSEEPDQQQDDKDES